MYNPFFKYLFHFSENENWGDPRKVDNLLLLILDNLRKQYNRPFHVLNAYATRGHAPKSWHYVGKAVDFYPIDELTPLPRVSKMVSCLKVLDRQFAPTGILPTEICALGFYLDWAHKGFHLDVRGEPLYWVRVDGKYHYCKTRVELIQLVAKFTKER